MNDRLVTFALGVLAGAGSEGGRAGDVPRRRPRAERGQSHAPGSIGAAVERVRAVVDRSELPPAGPGADEGILPASVHQVRRGPAGPGFLVDLEQMIDAARD